MIRAFIVGLLLPLSVLAQHGELFLQSSASMLAANRATKVRGFSPEQFARVRLDTLSASGQHYRFKAVNYLWTTDYEQAYTWLEKTATQYPKEHGFVGEMYLRQLRDYPRALAHFDAYDALTPHFDDIVGYNPVSYLRGLAHRAMGNHEKAIDEFTQAIEPLAQKHGAEWVNYRHFISRAVSYLATNQPEKALADLEKALKNFNRSALAYYYRSQALIQLNRTAEAGTALQDASFFFKALRAERRGDYQEDDFNPIYEPVIDEALDHLKKQNR